MRGTFRTPLLPGILCYDITSRTARNSSSPAPLRVPASRPTSSDSPPQRPRTPGPRRHTMRRGRSRPSVAPHSPRRLGSASFRRSGRPPAGGPKIVLLDLVSSPDGEEPKPDGSRQKLLKMSSKSSCGKQKRSMKINDRSCTDVTADDPLYNSLISNKRPRRTKIGGRCTNLRQQNQLDTNMFESYLEVLWKSTSKSQRRPFTYLDSLWFTLYKEGLMENGDKKEKVLRWIMDKQIFSCSYVFVPIVCWGHWNLLILCHIGENIDSETKKPCMLLLDSLEKTGPMRLEPDIRRFVWDIYNMSPNRRSSGKEMLKIPLRVPKVPQQKNGDDCGIFVLYFIYLFMRRAPEVFSLEHYPYFLTRKWFKFEEVEGFRDELLCERSKSR